MSMNERLFRDAVARRIRDVRKARGMSQAALAEAAGLSKNSISRYETGEAMPSLLIADKLAAVLDVSLRALVPRSLHTSVEQACDAEKAC
jgi:transcriptional regulator with XRE-family HTH domain